MVDWNIMFLYSSGFLYSRPEFEEKRTGSGSRRKSGVPLGTACTKGYLRISVDKSKHLVHRIIWEMHNGPIPEGKVIDHIDGNTSNNMIENLRLCTQQCNNYNMSGTSKTGMPKGVKRVRDKFYVRVNCEGVTYNGGKLFNTVEEAEAAAIELRNKLHGEFARHKSNLGKEA